MKNPWTDSFEDEDLMEDDYGDMVYHERVDRELEAINTENNKAKGEN